MTNGYYEPGFELTLYILIALELIVIGIVNFVVAIAIDNDANKLEKVCNDVKNMQQQSTNTTWSGVGFKPTNTNGQSINRTQSKPKVANSLQNCPICLHPLVDNKCSNCGFKG